MSSSPFRILLSRNRGISNTLFKGKQATVMRIVLVLVGLVAVVGFDVALGNARCQRAIRNCLVRNPPGIVRYDDCIEFCCGAAIYERDFNFECCGTESVGAPYNPLLQICCAWPFGNEYVVYDRLNNTNGLCCGPNIYDGTNNLLSCCIGWPGEPQVFNSRTEMCCEGIVQFAGNTAFTSCCGDTSYDRRIASCPCDNNVVVIGIPDKYAGCCYSDNQFIRIPYDIRTQECCGTEPYTLDGQFCCGGAVGNVTDQTCCGDIITPKDPDLADALVGCCLTSSGSVVAYNVATSACCGGRVQDKGFIGEALCCDGVLYNAAEAGDACCGDQAYFSLNQVCCNNVVGIGDSCCNGVNFTASAGLVCCENVIGIGDSCCNGVNFTASAGLVCCEDVIGVGDNCCEGEPFFSSDQVCCFGSLGPGDRCCADIPYFYDNDICCAEAVYPNPNLDLGCCVDVTFNIYNQTCCGVTVFDNPLVPDGQGGLVVSTHTRCCGNFAIASTLFPYDYNTQICCDGVIDDLNGLDPLIAECCGTEVVDYNTQLCCEGILVDLGVLNPSTAVCCGIEAVDNVLFSCCEGIKLANIYGPASECCGPELINGTSTICCAGVPIERPLVDVGGEIVYSSIAECCGLAAFDPTIQACCDGVVVENAFGLAGLCCGAVVIDPAAQLCCLLVPQDLPADVENAVCCGAEVMDPATAKCCFGVPRLLDGIAPEDAICCGEGCIDGSMYWCCDGKQYQKGSSGEAISGLTCGELFL